MATEQRLIGEGEHAKIKTPCARIVVGGTAEKPYYSIVWFDPVTKEYNLGYSSYCLEYVFNWLAECFEIADAPTIDARPVVHGRWEPHYETVDPDPDFGIVGGDFQTGWQCSVCGRYEWDKEPYCNCGAKMDGGADNEQY